MLWCAVAVSAALVALGASAVSLFGHTHSQVACLHAGRERDRAAMADFRFSKFAVKIRHSKFKFTHKILSSGINITSLIKVQYARRPMVD